MEVFYGRDTLLLAPLLLLCGMQLAWLLIPAGRTEIPDRTLDLVTVLLPYRTGAAAKLPQVEKLADGVLFRFADGHTAAVRMVNGKAVTEKR